VKALQRAGLVVRRQSGSHLGLTDTTGRKEVIVPMHGGRDPKRGTLRGIIRDADLTVEEFRRLLK
jgi:predicted RNA binding protein YcfA (HicA-like mRNA interferase family)